MRLAKQALQWALRGKGTEILRRLGTEALKSETVRRFLLGYIEDKLKKDEYDALVGARHRPPGVRRDMAWAAYAMLKSLDRGIREGRISPKVVDKLAEVFAGGVLLNWSQRGEISKRFQEMGEKGPPGFLVISPAKACNLRCEGCYAASGANTEKLSAEVFDRIITEAKELWGVRFFTISGGEPFLWRDGETRFLDIIEKHSDCYFLTYTNGTLIDEETAERLGDLANLTPAISLEGFREETDCRRGPGVYDKVLKAMELLRRHGVPFGISVTATRLNYKLILSDEFLDEFFERQGATYGWIFHYMPIGRGVLLDLMPTPEERVWMWRREWEVIRERGYFYVDFWNHGTFSAGCISGGRQGGYLYIDWNGDIFPCVFVPYSPVNIVEIYRQGGTLEDAYKYPFFKALRRWHDAYGFGKGDPQRHHNWLAQCAIRDNFLMMKRLVERYKPKPADDAARQLVEVPEYSQWMIEYGRRLRQLTEPIWREAYLRS